MTTQPPTVPGPPQQPYYPPPPPDPNAGIRKVGTVALWIWVLVAAVPVIAIIGCVGLCIVGGVAGSITGTTHSTP